MRRPRPNPTDVRRQFPESWPERDPCCAGRLSATDRSAFSEKTAVSLRHPALGVVHASASDIGTSSSVAPAISRISPTARRCPSGGTGVPLTRGGCALDRDGQKRIARSAQRDDLNAGAPDHGFRLRRAQSTGRPPHRCGPGSPAWAAALARRILAPAWRRGSRRVARGGSSSALLSISAATTRWIASSDWPENAERPIAACRARRPGGSRRRGRAIGSLGARGVARVCAAARRSSRNRRPGRRGSRGRCRSRRDRWRKCFVTALPLTSVPLVLPRSSRNESSRIVTTAACSPLTAACGRQTSLSGRRPIVTRSRSSLMSCAVPSGRNSTSLPTAACPTPRASSRASAAPTRSTGGTPWAREPARPRCCRARRSGWRRRRAPRPPRGARCGASR